MISLNFGRNPFQNISLKKRKQIKNIQDLKKKFEMENFLKLDIDRSDISNFVRLRISNSILMIEKSRHRQIDLENRSSPLCKFEVENELSNNNFIFILYQTELLLTLDKYILFIKLSGFELTT